MPNLSQSQNKATTEHQRGELIVNKKDKLGEIRILGSIGGWWGGINAETFVREWAALEAECDDIDIYMNTPGGVVMEALTMYNTIRRSKANTRCIIEGYAFSCGSFLAMAAKKTVILEQGMMMTHNPQGGCWGDAQAMVKYAELLNKTTEQILSIYLRNTDSERDELIQMMNDETYLTAQEALDKGWVDEIISGSPATNLFDPLAFVVDKKKGAELLHISEPSNSQLETFLQHARESQAVNEGAPTPKNEGGELEMSGTQGTTPQMTLELLKSSHADIYNAVFKEGSAAGQSAERVRCTTILEQAGDHNVELVTGLVKDGSDEVTALKKILEADRTFKANKRDEATAQAQHAVNTTATGGEGNGDGPKPLEIPKDRKGAVKLFNDLVAAEMAGNKNLSNKDAVYRIHDKHPDLHKAAFGKDN